jgi:hypothetical protein
MNRRLTGCVAALVGVVPVLIAEGVGAQESTKEPTGILVDANVNVLGPAQFGVAPTVEVGAGHWAGHAYLRWLSSGLLAHSLLPNRDAEKLAFSYGVGAGGRYYTKPGLWGFHVGAGVEYLHVVVESEPDREAYISSWVVPQLALGYRWKLDQILIGIGGSSGFAISTSARAEDRSNGADPIEYNPDDVNRPFGSASLEVGYFF